MSNSRNETDYLQPPIHLGYRKPTPIQPQHDKTTGIANEMESSGETLTTQSDKTTHHCDNGQGANETGHEPWSYPPGSLEPIYLDDGGHLITVAPTGAGKTIGAVVPNLLIYPGAAVVTDPKGELYDVTASRRRAMGQEVILLDPYGITGEKTGSFNPLQYMWELKNIFLEDEAQSSARTLTGQVSFARDPFWDNTASALLAGVILYMVSVLEAKERTLGKLYQLLHGDDVVYKQALILDTVKNKLNEVGYQEIAAFLQNPDVTRGGILTTAQQHTKIFSSPQMMKVLEKSSFSMKKFIDGKPMTIYMVLPPDKLRSHGSILLLWMTALMKAIVARKSQPKHKTLFLIDECAQLGHMPQLEEAMTIGRIYGIQCWSIWQSLSQLRTLYPISWNTIIHNASVLQVFGSKNHLMNQEFSEITGSKPEFFQNLSGAEQCLVLNGQRPERTVKPNYLRDPAYAGLYKANRFYRKGGGRQTA